MVKILKNHLSLCALTTVSIFFSYNTQIYADISGNRAQLSPVVNIVAQNAESKSSCDKNGSSCWYNDGAEHIISDKTYQKTDDNADKTVAIQASKEGTKIKGNNITIKDSLDTDGSNKSFWKYGVMADDWGEIYIKEGVINFTNGTAVYIGADATVYLKGVSIIQKGNIEKHGQNSALEMSRSLGRLAFGLGNIKVTDAHGVSLQGNENDLSVAGSTFVVEDDTSYGIYFWEEKEAKDQQYKNSQTKEQLYSFYGDNVLFGSLPQTDLPMRGYVTLQASSFEVPKSIVIYSRKSGALIDIKKDSKMSGDLLLKGEDNSFVKVSADSSTLIGGVRLDRSSTAEFRLRNESKWTLTRPKNQNLHDSGSVSNSSISLLHLIDSYLAFEEPNSSESDNYQTLRIGRGVGEVYKAQGDAHFYLNTYLNKGGRLLDQKTDRILIHGDVSGKTIVHVRAVSGSPGGGTGFEGSNKGISIIQVSGKAEKDSFELDGGYVALKNSPYQYVLHAYGPGSGLEKASAAQRLVEGGGEFWDFRLENGHIDSDTPPVSSPGSKPALAPDASPVSFPGSKPAPAPNLHPEPGLKPFSGPTEKPHPESIVKAVVPQVPTYLLLPASVFHAGLMDISNQSKQLEMLRTTSTGMLEVRENPALYLHSYGGRFRYTSNLSAREYGYGGNLNYNAVEAGVLLQTIESAESTISLGVIGSYGKFSLKPLNVEQSQESAFDKWTGTAYGSVQHDSGLYVDGLFSYGFLKGDVRTSARGKTATLKGNPLSVSLTGGQAFDTGYEGFVFDPQVQVVYQRLQFGKARDVDDFSIDMGKLDQWVARVGGRLVKIPREFEGMNSIAFYGKLYFSHNFGRKQSVRFKDAFQLGAFGSSLEAGLGFNARLSRNFVLQADMIYQHKLTKAGFSGVGFSGGLHYQF
ncbi:autotransporter outer membrane beta-barrel domain-containing protein [Bartonella sp. B39]